LRPTFASRSSLLVGSLLLVACGGSVPQPRNPGVQGERPSPLGQSYTLNPLPSDDDSLLTQLAGAFEGRSASPLNGIFMVVEIEVVLPRSV